MPTPRIPSDAHALSRNKQRSVKSVAQPHKCFEKATTCSHNHSLVTSCPVYRWGNQVHEVKHHGQTFLPCTASTFCKSRCRISMRMRFISDWMSTRLVFSALLRKVLRSMSKKLSRAGTLLSKRSERSPRPAPNSAKQRAGGHKEQRNRSQGVLEIPCTSLPLHGKQLSSSHQKTYTLDGAFARIPSNQEQNIR